MADAGKFTMVFGADTKEFAAKVSGMMTHLRSKLNEGAQSMLKNQMLQFFSLQAIASEMKQLVAYADRYYDLSKKLGVGTTFLQSVGYAMEQSGSDIGSAVFAIKELKLSLSRLTSADISAFEKLGLSVNELKSAKPEDVFGKIIEAGKKLSNDELQSVFSNIFGRGFLSMIPLVEEGWNNLNNEFERLNLAIDEMDVKKLADIADTMDRMRTVKYKVAATAVPLAEGLLEGLRAEFAMIQAFVNSTMVGMYPKGNLTFEERGRIGSKPLDDLWNEWKQRGIDEANKEAGAPSEASKLLWQKLKERQQFGSSGIGWMQGLASLPSMIAKAMQTSSLRGVHDFDLAPGSDSYSRMGLFLTPGIAGMQNTVMGVMKEQLQETKRTRTILESINSKTTKDSLT